MSIANALGLTNEQFMKIVEERQRKMKSNIYAGIMRNAKSRSVVPLLLK